MLNRLIITISTMVIAFTAALNASADTLSITRQIVFEEHQFSSTADSPIGNFTRIADRYTFADTSSIIVPAGTYDRIELNLTVAPGHKFFGEDVVTPAITIVDVLWQVPGGSGSAPAEPFDLSFTGGSAGLPTGGTGHLTFADTKEVVWVATPTSIILPDAAFSFTSMTMGQAESPAVFATDTEMFLDEAEIDFIYSYFVLVNDDPGRFTFITPIPEPNSLALLSVGGLLVAGRRGK